MNSESSKFGTSLRISKLSTHSDCGDVVLSHNDISYSNIIFWNNSYIELSRWKRKHVCSFHVASTCAYIVWLLHVELVVIIIPTTKHRVSFYCQSLLCNQPESSMYCTKFCIAIQQHSLETLNQCMLLMH